MKQMNIVIMTGHSGIESGGVGTHLKVLLDELEKDKEINLKTIFGKGKQGKIHILINRLMGKNISFGLTEVLEFFINIYYMKNMLQKVLNSSPKSHYIIHAHDRNAAIAAGLLKNRYSLKIIQTIHAPYYQQYLINANLPEDSLLKEFIRTFDANTIKYVDSFIAVDDLQKDLMIRDFSDRLKSKKMTVITNAVEDKLLVPLEKKDQEKYIVVARHLYKKNGVEYAIRAFNELKYKYNLKMYIIGSGDEEKNLKKLVEDFKLEEQIIFKGRIQRKEVIEYIRNAFISLVPSVPVGDYIEATSLTMLETMAMKTPLIASNIGGIKQVLDGKDAAYLLEPCDSLAIAKIIDQLYVDPSQSLKKIENAYRLIENEYSSSIWYNKIKQWYGDLD